METDKPTIGRIVHYVDQYGTLEAGERHRPAMIAELPEGRVTLLVFGAPQNEYVYNAQFNETTKPKRTWHWPERE